MLSTLLLSTRVHRRSVLRAPEVLAAVAISPKPALSNATRDIALLSTFVAAPLITMRSMRMPRSRRARI
jgi:hypothetical protein